MKRLLPLLASILLLHVTQANAQFYTIDDACSTVLEDISGTGTALGLGDDGEALVTMPFAFTLYDITSSDLEIDNNGGIVFNSTGTGNINCCTSGAGLPNGGSFDAAILPFWDDIDSDAGDVYHETRGTAPNRRFIVQWHQRPHFSNVGAATFQAILYETSNEVRFVYDDIDFGNALYDNGVSATIGLQKDGATADQYSHNTSIAGITCILFTPPPPPIVVDCQSITVELDAAGNYSFDIPLTPEIDAEQPVAAGSSTALSQFQTFTAARNGLLHSVSVELAGAYTGGNLLLEVFDGDAIAGIPPLLSNTFVTSLVPTGLNEFIIDASVEVVAGNTYTWVLTDGTATTGVNLSKNDGDLYAGGYNQTSPTSDFVFNTKVLQRPEIDNGTTDSDGLASFGLSQTAFDCSDAGTTIPVTLSATDNLGNVGTCLANVTVEDNEDPVAVCVPYQAASQVTHTYGATPALPIPDADPIGITSVINVPETYDVFDINVDLTIDHTWNGDLQVILTSPDGTPVELIPLSYICSQNDLDVTFDDAAGAAFTDQCATPITGTFMPSSPLSGFNGEDVNGNWSLYVSDNTGADFGTLQSWGMTIIEDIPEMVTMLSLDATGNYTVDALNDIDAGSSDNCGVTLTTSPASFTCADIGVQAITLTATDPTGNTDDCSTFVEIVDDMAPTALCQAFTLNLDGAGSGTLTTGDIDNASTDNCNISSMSLDLTSFNCSDIGDHTVTLSVEDDFAQVSTCTATVTVADSEDPVLTCPLDIVVCSESASGATVLYTTPTATDNCTFSISQTDVTGLTIGSTFPIGVTAQQWTVTDAGTNSVACDFTVTVNASPTADYSYTAACQGESTFYTDLSTIDASSSITMWEWDMGDGSSPIGIVDPIHAYADLGTYDVELVVTSAEGCTDTLVQAVSVTPVPIAGFTFVTACEGDATVFTNTSTITAGTLNYSWDFGDGSPASTDENPSYTYALDGTYTVVLTVTSDDGCEDVSTQSVTVNDSPTALFSASTECEGTATVFTNLSTGDGVLDYSWNFGDASPVSTDVNPTYTYAADGTYAVVLTVTNDNGCVSISTVSVTVNNLPNADFTFSDVCEGTPADFVNTSDAGTYNWDLGDGNSSTLTDVSHVYDPFGSYDVTLTVTSPEFCLNSVTQTIEIFDLPDFTLTPTDVLCYGEATGELMAVAVPPAATPWTLSIDGGTPQASVTFGGLVAGTYDITAFDANGCEFTVAGTVDQPSDTLGIDISGLVDILCNGETSGEIDITGTGGTAPYMYSVNAGTPQATGMFAGLEAATHAIQIVDANLCVFDTLITLTEPDTLVNTLVNSEDLLCNGDGSGEIAVFGTGGVMPYEYNLDGGTYASDSTFTGLAAATYVVGVRDANGCIDTLHVTLTEPGILQLSLVAVSDAVCFEESNGSIEVAAASGTPPYQYSLDGISFQGGGLFEGLAAGTYTVTVMDANGCLDDLTETVFEPSELTIETNSVPVACFGDATGEIEIIANGGTPGYEYSIDGGGSFDPNGGLFADVVMGNYLTVVEDANGCTASEGVIISQPASVFILDADVTDAACLDSTSGSIQLIGTGGTPTYVYSSDNTSFSSTSLFEGYGAGTYTLYAQDLNGCSDSLDVTVGQPATSVEITTTLLANPACPNEASGTATVQATGGTPGYMYSSDGGTTYQASQILAGLNGGNHLVMVQDANGCVDSDTITMITPNLMDITLDSIVGVDCEGDFTGEIHVTGIGGTPSYNYFLDGGSLQSNGDYTGLTDGTYSISIMDVNGCTYAEDVVVAATQMLPVANFGFSISGTAVAFTNSSQFGDSYLWEFGDDSTSTEMSPVHVYLEDGDYTVTLTVTNSCGSETVTLLVSTTTIGIKDNEEVSFGLYPNPASTEIFIQPSQTINSELTIDVISTSGQLIRSTQSPGVDVTERIRIDVNGLSNGMYYLRIVGIEQQSVLRFDIIK